MDRGTLFLFFADSAYFPSTWCTIKYVYPIMSWAYMGSVQTMIALTVERFLSIKRLEVKGINIIS